MAQSEIASAVRRTLLSCVPIVIAALISGAFAACSKSADDDDKQVRPGEKEDVHIPADIRFTTANVEIAVDVSPANGTFDITIERSGDWLPDTTYTLTSDNTGGSLTLPSVIHFEVDQTAITTSVGYSISLEPLGAYTVFIYVKATADAEAQQMRVDIYRPSEWQQDMTGTYATGANTFSVNVRSRTFDGGRQYQVQAVDNTAFIRTFTRFDDGVITVDGGVAAVDGWSSFVSSDSYVAEGYTVETLKAVMPIYSLSSIYDEDGRYYALCLTYIDDTSFEPRYDVLRLDSEQDAQWRRLDDVTFVDGWLVGVVSFRLEAPPLPADCPWPVEAWANVDNPDIIRLTGLYRVASPLSKINSCAQMTSVDVLLDTAEATATIESSFSGFNNSDLFSSPFNIKGCGVYVVDAEGNTVITIESPMHNAYGEYSTWATPYATVITARR